MKSYKTLMLGSAATSALLLGAAVAPAYSASNVEVGHKKGHFYIKTKDGKFSVIPGAQIQAQYTYRNNEEGEDVTQFAARRVRFGVKGRGGHKKLTYSVTLEISTNSEAGQDGDANIAIFDSYLNWKFANALQLRAGTWKQRFTEYHSNSSGKNQFVDRNRGTANRLRMERDTGLGIRGKLFKMLSYEATILDGNTRKAPSANANQSWHAHVRVEPFGGFGAPYEGDIKNSKKLKVQVAAATYYKDHVTFSTRGNQNSFISKAGKANIYAWTVGAGLKWRGFGLYGEYAWMNMMDGQVTPTASDATGQKTAGARAQAWNIEASYFLIPKKWSVAGRWEYLDENMSDKDHQTGATNFNGGLDDEHRYGIATSYFIHGQAHKLVFDWVREDDHGAASDGGTLTDDEFRLFWQVRF